MYIRYYYFFIKQLYVHKNDEKIHKDFRYDEIIVNKKKKILTRKEKLYSKPNDLKNIGQNKFILLYLTIYHILNLIHEINKF